MSAVLRLVGHLGKLANYPAYRNYTARVALQQAGISAGEVADYGLVRVLMFMIPMATACRLCG